jgi:UDP-N-acetylglucosamine 2-epimerase (non-hydrolysing)
LKKILVLFGTRPELIKLAPVIKSLKRSKEITPVVCSTGQHREMLKQVMDIFDIELDVDLDLMKPNQDLFDISANVLTRLRDVFADMKPDCIIVQGDTTTAFIASLSAFYLRIKVAHVEAGLRSYNIQSPYPEEANRRFISVVADYHFTPTSLAEQNLLKEGFTKNNIWTTGNTVVDALEYVKESIASKETQDKVKSSLKTLLPDGFQDSTYVLVTLHRREKFGKSMEEALLTIKELAISHPDMNFIYPLHLNPNVFKPAKALLEETQNIYLIPPQDYLCFNYLMANSHFIMSDSGGIQEEAYTYKKPILVLRDVTERMEAIDAGYAFLVGNDREKIIKNFENIKTKLRDNFDFFSMPNPYGDGQASDRITAILTKNL